MPFATFTRVREVSSEDNVHLAENLIKIAPGKKWKTKNVGEKSAYVILEMSECYQITGIDIGNEHSAFVEILVGKSASSPEDFKEILITCSFMTPNESKSSNNTNRVRCFNRESLVPSVADSKWSLVKIFCTQPFNKHVAYGLSFIKVHINDKDNNATLIKKNLVPDQFISKTTNVIDKLKYREDSPDSESNNSLSLFNRWKKSKNNIVEPTTAAAIRIASKSLVTLVAHRSNNVQKPQTSQSMNMADNILDRNREKILYGDENDDTNNENTKNNERLSEQIEADKERLRVEREISKNKRKSLDVSKSFEITKDVGDKLMKPSCSKSSFNGNKHASLEHVKKRSSSPQKNPNKKMKPTIKFRPFNQLLNGVVLVISGIQNPDRGELRKKAIALGAKYKADWDSTCTHLICAFKNTPKYNQVRGKGKIVTRNWIEKCYGLKKYLPWRRYALDSIELSKSESDEEIFDDTQNHQTDENSTDNSLRKSREVSEDSNNTLTLYDIDDQPKKNKTASNNSESSSESDTDDEIKRVKQKANIIDIKPSSKSVNIFDASTDEEDYINEKIHQSK